MSRHFYASRLVSTGGKHRAGGLPGQDHAVAVDCDQGAVLVVADGVSRINGDWSRAEIGAYLAAHLAARAAVDALAQGLEPGAIKGQIGAALYHGLRGLWTELPDAASMSALISTLLVAVVTGDTTLVWVSGDGAWGLCVPRDTEVRRGDLPSAVEWDVRQTSCGHGRIVRGQTHTQRMGRTAVTESRRSPEHAAAQLHLVLAAQGPTVGAWVATDGLADEPRLAGALDLPIRSREVLDAALQRPPMGDDVAIAWAAERFPGLLGGPVIASAGGGA